jgi:hypothetical protein
MRYKTKISEAHVNYLEHQRSKPLGSFGPPEIRESLKMLLAGKLPRKKPDPHKYYTQGQIFRCYNRPRLTVELDIAVAEKRQILKAEPTPASHDSRAPAVEFLIDGHGYPLGYYMDNHVCNKWCSADGGDPCPGMVFRKAKSEKSEKSGRKISRKQA